MVRPPRLPYRQIAASILPGWEISLAFAAPRTARAANKKLRGKNYIPNVLSYKVGKKSGEIIICPSEAAKQAPEYQMPARQFVLYLFIHALLHLKGWAHGAKMARCERQLLLKYGSKNSDWHRHRDVSGQSGRRRRSR